MRGAVRPVAVYVFGGPLHGQIVVMPGLVVHDRQRGEIVIPPPMLTAAVCPLAPRPPDYAEESAEGPAVAVVHYFREVLDRLDHVMDHDPACPRLDEDQPDWCYRYADRGTRIDYSDVIPGDLSALHLPG
jgi:hypothetical protein